MTEGTTPTTSLEQAMKILQPYMDAGFDIYVNALATGDEITIQKSAMDAPEPIDRSIVESVMVHFRTALDNGELQAPLVTIGSDYCMQSIQTQDGEIDDIRLHLLSDNDFGYAPENGAPVTDTGLDQFLAAAREVGICPNALKVFCGLTDATELTAKKHYTLLSNVPEFQDHLLEIGGPDYLEDIEWRDSCVAVDVQVAEYDSDRDLTTIVARHRTPGSGTMFNRVLHSFMS